MGDAIGNAPIEEKGSTLLKSSTQSLAIVKGNCYSETVNAALISEFHTAKDNSVFKYDTFTFTDQSGQSSQLLECVVDLCLPDEDCVRRDCDPDPSMQYSLYG